MTQSTVGDRPVPDRRVEAPRLPAALTDAGALELADSKGDGVVLEGAAITGGGLPAEVDDLELVECRLSAVAFTGAVLRAARITDVVLEDCELSGSTWEGASFQRVRFQRCRMSGFTAAELAASHVSFVDCKLDGAWLRMATLERCGFESCDLTGSDLYRAQVRLSSFLRCTLDRSELSGATLRDVALHGSSLVGLSGASALAGSTIGPDQLTEVALSVLPALGITIAEEGEG